MAETDCLLVLCTCPPGPAAAELAEKLVDERLAACVNQLPGVLSSFHWEGRVQQDAETLLLIKTTRAGLDGLTTRIRELHPYELPEVLAVPVMGGLESYLDWIRASVADPHA